MTYYRIRDWQRHFENNRTRDMEKMRWVPVPNKHDGEGFQRIMQEKDGIIIYGCWHLILQVASKLRERGTLLRDDGTPITADTLALKTGWRRPQDFQRTLDFCSSGEMAWIERLSKEGAENPQAPAENPQEGARNGMEGIEEKGRTHLLPFGECQKVRLTDEEYAKLITKHGEAKAKAAIEVLDGYIASKNKRYANHYAVLKEGSWVWDRVNAQPAARPANNGMGRSVE